MGEKNMPLGDVPSAKTYLAADELCQKGNEELVFCKVCGTYLHCKPDEEGPWLKRSGEANAISGDQESTTALRGSASSWVQLKGWVDGLPIWS
jgi:hypothetical protein